MSGRTGKHSDYVDFEKNVWNWAERRDALCLNHPGPNVATCNLEAYLWYRFHFELDAHCVDPVRLQIPQCQPYCICLGCIAVLNSVQQPCRRWKDNEHFCVFAWKFDQSSQLEPRHGMAYLMKSDFNMPCPRLANWCSPMRQGKDSKRLDV